MRDERPTSEQVERLHARWAEDRSSRLFLQLAEEYRRLGRLSEAVEVLEEGLARHPNYLSAQVALARCRLELGEPERARRLLQQVVSQDPTQLVANKLLVEAQLAMGDRQAAEHRLRTYTLLNPSDPEIEDLGARIHGAAGAEATAAAAPPPVVEPSEPAPPAAPMRPAPDESPFLLSRPEAPAPDLGELMAPPPLSGASGDGEQAVAANSPAGDGVGAEEGEPFVGLAAAQRLRAQLSGLLAGDVFGLAAGGAAEVWPTVEAPPPVDADTVPAEREETAPGAAQAPPEEAVEPVVAQPPAADGAQTPEVDETATLAEGDAETIAPTEAPQATVTLGRLYLRQGHPRDAEAIFRRVLDVEPDNAEARGGLAEAARARAGGLTARELLAEVPEERQAAGLTARKIELLKRYLAHLGRAGRQ